MLKNYFKIALRSLRKNIRLTSINVIGLSAGLACSLLIVLFVQDELSYDNHYSDAENIYRVVKDFINDDGSRIPDATTPGPLAHAMQREIPEVVTITRIHPNWGGTTLMQYGDKRIQEEKVWRVDSSFFSVFSTRFIKGDPRTALKDINSIVLTETAANRYFGKEDPIGKTMRMDNQDDVTVTAVVDDVPAQSHFHYDFLLSYRRLPAVAHTNWGSYNYYTYVKVTSGTDIKAFEKKIQGVYERNQEERYSVFYVQPLTEIHLTSKLKWELEANGDKIYVFIFIIIGIFILLIAAINYINLSTARSTLRAKETGIRKISGAQRTSLVFQFLLESVVLCFIASVVAFAIAYALLPTVNELTQKNLNVVGNPIVIMYLVGVTVIIGMVAGLFPALYLSSFQPVAVLKGFKLNERGALNLRKSLVVVQFTISVSLIIGVLIISQQIQYIHSVNLGFDKDQVLVVQGVRGLSRAERNAMLNSIRELPGVKKAATSSTVLGRGGNTTRLRAVGSEQEQQLNFSGVDFDYLDVVGIEILEGRGFSRDYPADSLNNGILGGALMQRLGGIVVNEQAVKEFGLSSPAVGKQLIWSTDGDTTYYVEVVGVAKNFHFTSLRNEIKPYGFLVFQNQSNFTIKLAGGNISETIGQIEHLWKQARPDAPFQYLFLDETLNKMYAAEGRFQKVFASLVVLGILISCLGLFALAAFSAEQRVKEIGIRKVLGASVPHLVALMSKDFLKLIVLSVALSVPLAAYSMNEWLSGFAYHVEIHWWIFVLAALIAILIAFATISTQAFKAATTDPVKNLRTE